MKRIRKISAILLTGTLLAGCSYKIETKGPSDSPAKETQSTVKMTESTEVSGNDLADGKEAPVNDLASGYSYLEQVTISNDGYEVPVYSIKNPISRFLDGTLVTCQKSGIDFECYLSLIHI